jgi:hypothetical protein
MITAIIFDQVIFSPHILMYLFHWYSIDVPVPTRHGFQRIAYWPHIEDEATFSSDKCRRNSEFLTEAHMRQ